MSENRPSSTACFYSLLSHLIHFTKGGEQGSTPIIIVIVCFGPLPFKEGQNDSCQKGGIIDVGIKHLANTIKLS